MNGRGAHALTRTSDRRPPSRIRSQPLRLAQSLDRTTNFRHIVLSADTGRSPRLRAAREQHARSPPRVSREARRTFVEPFLTAPFACAAVFQRRRESERGRHTSWARRLRRRCARREPAAHAHVYVVSPRRQRFWSSSRPAPSLPRCAAPPRRHPPAAARQVRRG